MENGWHKKPRKTSDAKGGFPYADERVPFILVTGDDVDVEGGGMNWSYRAEEKLSLIAAAKANPAFVILSVWPGKTRTDVFAIDDLDEAEAALA